MDYHLEAEIEHPLEGCDGDKRMSTLSVQSKNTVQADVPLSADVASSSGLISRAPIEIPLGGTPTSARRINTAKASSVSLLAIGQTVPINPGRERRHLSWEAQVAKPPWQYRELSYCLWEPKSRGCAPCTDGSLVEDRHFRSIGA